ncbi:acyl carrier protein 3, mitochondrial [Argentina anserina]|uniref:acyl carrier protein 3, mitochondrial n=1 Tax=Argentina anserina TaxID=57926 RepID=UPI0021762B1C|nr:acyl carrier protein 3, mitochondrial [Potentilla anserina]
MQSVKNSILWYVRIGTSPQNLMLAERGGNVPKCLSRHLCASTITNTDQILDRVVGLVKKFDRIESSKVTETAHFQKDLSLDSLDRVELVMAFEEEFSIEIPEKADELTCCADVAKYIVSEADQKSA